MISKTANELIKGTDSMVTACISNIVFGDIENVIQLRYTLEREGIEEHIFHSVEEAFVNVVQ